MAAPQTILEALIAQLRLCATVTDGDCQVAAVLWTDQKSEWKSAIDEIRLQLPELVSLGDYAPEKGRGPAIWLRCVVDKTVKVSGIGPSTVPIIYIPGFSRNNLRADASTPDSIEPLVYLVYRGKVWCQSNQNDWGVVSFISNQAGLGLQIARDEATQTAILNSLGELITEPLSVLRGRTLVADDFNRLVTPDIVKSFLQWMDSPDAFKARSTEATWAAFCGQIANQFAFNIANHGRLTALERLCTASSSWAGVWSRFEENPTIYPNIVASLPSIQASDLLAPVTHWCSAADRRSAELESAVAALVGKPIPKTREALLKLDKEYAELRTTVWAKLGRAKAAVCLESLASLAQLSSMALSGTNPETFRNTYVDKGWKVDAAFIRVICLTGEHDLPAFRKLATALYHEWADASAREFQKAVLSNGLTSLTTSPVVEVGQGGCIIFADGLRYDVGQNLAESLKNCGLNVAVDSRWAALPTVTATAKPAVSPAARKFIGKQMPADFAPLDADGNSVVAALIRKRLEEQGYQILKGPNVRPESSEVKGWVELGKIDTRGHDMESDMAKQLDEEIESLSKSVQALFDNGWKSVRIVTDHGWLLLPGGLPKVDLPRLLTESRWARCAVANNGTPTDTVPVSWFWNAGETVHTPPGISCFNKSPEYTHGGLSIQECLIPDISVRPGNVAAILASIRDVSWNKYRCLVECSGNFSGMKVDIRLGTPNGKSALPAPKAVPDDGHLSIPVDDIYEGQNLYVVLLGADNQPVAQRSTKLGQS
jgi:hypothetical protein